MIEEQIDHRRDKPDAEAAVRDTRPRPQQKRTQSERTLLPISSSEERANGFEKIDEEKEKIDGDDDDPQDDRAQTEHLLVSQHRQSNPVPETTRSTYGSEGPRSSTPTDSDDRNRGCIYRSLRFFAFHMLQWRQWNPRGGTNR